ncbi:hypothetical protein D9758_001224 [Tetrapyrgos nigripes]|uniref:DUF4187 domain-containing protein n=1 Tax=Tetrapyrgos nigripes TaxID=182062 RepID=A0A8H5GSE1_9AGAR|nr:hypothetical protein D9758_001224 [Tetrapyrgos nigripes]
MSDGEDDYLSDKFLVESSAPSTSNPKTYSQLRKDAEKKAKTKNDQNRTKSRRERELEAREEGLNKSLFTRAQEDEQSGGAGNKALSIMMKMGFKPGQSLGRVGDVNKPDRSSSERPEDLDKVAHNDDVPATGAHSSLTAIPSASKEVSHRTEPLPLTEWAGRKGIGTSRKRGPSPSAAERVAKMAKMAEQAASEDFRDRTRREYQERRAEGRLGPAQRTCANLDEKAGKNFNVLWLNPGNPDTFPPGFIDALGLHTTVDIPSYDDGRQGDREDIATRLRREIKSNALQPVDSDEQHTSEVNTFSEEVLEEAAQFLRLQAQDRLALVLSYLRDHYDYCFWCGTQYDDQDEMEEQCPGPEEEAHD